MKHPLRRLRKGILWGLVAVVGTSGSAGLVTAHAGEVNVYSYRKPQLIDPMFEVFTEQTGIKVNSVFAKKRHAGAPQERGKKQPC